MRIRQKILCGIIIAATLASLIFINLFTAASTQYDIAVGFVSPEDIYASRNITDSVTTSARKKAASDAVADIYVTDSAKTDAAVKEVDDFLKLLSGVLASEEEDKKALLASVSNFELSDSVSEYLSSLSSSGYSSFSLISDYVKSIMQAGVKDKDEALSEFDNLLSEEHFPSSAREAASTVAAKVITVNCEKDDDATAAAREAAASAVSDVTYLKNQTIVSRGEVVTEAQYAMLKELGFIKGSAGLDILHTASIVMLILFSVLLCTLYYISSGRNKISASPTAVCLICAALSLIGSLLAYFGSDMMYLLPLSLCPALMALLLGANMSSLVNIVVSLSLFFATGDASTAFASAIAGAACAMFFSRVRRRSQLLTASLFSSLVYGFSYAAFFADTATNLLSILTVFGKGFTGALLGGILSIGIIPFMETIFDVITPMKLGELSNPEHRLLKKLMQKAPGSYHHSLTVANMADAAASAIGANSLLARVGAYYHDIGKMNNPLFFKENQINILNPHDALPPEESAEIIIRHVRDGAALADSYHLPKAVKNIILCHHGTTATSYFLFKAKAQNPNVDTKLFTYPGPAPHTREETIIMLADACEAAVRAMREKSDVDAASVVEDIISSRIADGQLSASELSFEDLAKVKASFAETLDQYFHKRIIYPQNEKTT